MATFMAAFADPFGTNMCDVRAPIKLAFVRNAAPTASVSLDLEEEASGLLTGALRDGFPRLKVWRNGTLALNAPWAPTQETGNDGDAPSTVDAQFRGPFAMFERRFTAAAQEYTGEDAGHIAWDLINASQSGDGSAGISLGTIETTIARDRTYADKQISDAITELTNVQGGFDFEVTPADSGITCGTFSVFAHQGQDRSATVRFEFGPDTAGNVRQILRQTSYPTNKVLALGADGLRSEQVSAGSILLYGTHKVVEQSIDVSDQSTLDALALGLLRPDPIRVVSFTPDPELAPQPWDDFWLGDAVDLVARFGTFDLNITVRVNGIDLTIDEDGNVASMELAIDQAV